MLKNSTPSASTPGNPSAVNGAAHSPSGRRSPMAPHSQRCAHLVAGVLPALASATAPAPTPSTGLYQCTTKARPIKKASQSKRMAASQAATCRRITRNSTNLFRSANSANSITFSSAPRREADSQPISQLDRPAVSQTETHTLGFLSVADTGPSSGENNWSQNWQWPNCNAGEL